MMEDIESEIRLEEYLRTNGVAEGEVLKWTKKYDIKISEHPIKDKVYYWENVDFFNLSPFEDFKMFLSKNEETEVWLGYENKYKEKLSQNLKIVFYSFTNINPVQIIVNDVKYELTPEKWKINEFPVSSQEIQTIKFIYNGVEVDYTKNYGDIMRNQIYYNNRKR
jgi:hypothetical protein